MSRFPQPYLLTFRANLKAFLYILTTNDIYNGHIYVLKSHLEQRKKLIFLPQNQVCIGIDKIENIVLHMDAILGR